MFLIQSLFVIQDFIEIQKKSVLTKLTKQKLIFMNNILCCSYKN